MRHPLFLFVSSSHKENLSTVRVLRGFSGFPSSKVLSFSFTKGIASPFGASYINATWFPKSFCYLTAKMESVTKRQVLIVPPLRFSTPPSVPLFGSYAGPSFFLRC